MHRPDDPGRRWARHVRGWAHLDHRRRALVSRDRHRANRTPASASCPGSDEASRPDADQLSRPDEACGCRCFQGHHPDGSYQPRQGVGRGDGHPCPAVRRTGCCPASVRRDGDRQSSGSERPDAERPDAEPPRPPDVARRSAPEDAAQETPGAEWMSWMPPTAGPAMAGPGRAWVLLQPAWAEQRVQLAPQLRQPDGSEPLQVQGQQSPGAQARQRSPTFREPCAPQEPQGLTRRTGRIRPCR